MVALGNCINPLNSIYIDFLQVNIDASFSFLFLFLIPWSVLQFSQLFMIIRSVSTTIFRISISIIIWQPIIEVFFADISLVEFMKPIMRFNNVQNIIPHHEFYMLKMTLKNIQSVGIYFAVSILSMAKSRVKVEGEREV